MSRDYTRGDEWEVVLRAKVGAPPPPPPHTHTHHIPITNIWLFGKWACCWYCGGDKSCLPWGGGRAHACWLSCGSARVAGQWPSRGAHATSSFPHPPTTPQVYFIRTCCGRSPLLQPRASGPGPGLVAPPCSQLSPTCPCSRVLARPPHENLTRWAVLHNKQPLTTSNSWSRQTVVQMFTEKQLDISILSHTTRERERRGEGWFIKAQKLT